jgi:PAS domain S-box-containing protein
MSLRLKIWLILGVAMFGVSGLAITIHYRAIETDARARMHQQALDLRAALMATRRVYHKQFIDSGLPLDDHTLGFLPAHAMSRIAEDFPHWTQSGVRFNNVSDRPRNPLNQADVDELAAMAWFRQHPKAAEYIQPDTSKDGKNYFHFSAPIWTEPYCLNCHDTPETAPPTIRQRYEAGYGYQPGDLRGVMSIRIPVDSMRDIALQHWQREVAGLVVLLLVLFGAIGLLLNRFMTRRLMALARASQQIAEGEYSTRVVVQSRDEIGLLAHSFNEMAVAVEQREKALRETQQSYRILAEYSWNWDYWLGADDHYRYVSPACEAISGHAPADFIADPGLFESLLHPSDQVLWREHLMQNVDHPEQHPHSMMAMRIRRPDGSYHWIEHACRPVFDAAGVYLGRRGINLDIAERKRIEELEHYSAFQAGIAEMSTSVLHNIGNAITAVTQDAETIDHASGDLARVVALLASNGARCREVLEEKLLDTKQLDANTLALADLARRQCAIQLEAASAIERLSEQTLRPRAHSLGESVRHIAGIVRIQQTAARPNGQCSSFSLTQAIRSVLEMQGDSFNKRGIVVSVAVDPRVDLLTLPHNRLLQALVNAIRNGIESIDNRAEKETFQASLSLRAEPVGEDRVRIEVADNGAGVDPGVRENLFRFGFSTKQRGSGFGLHSVAMFAQEVGGKAMLESDGTGQGARLVLELPLRSTTPRNSGDGQ